MSGPIPKRSAQRRRRNETWIDRVQVVGGSARAPKPPADCPPKTGKGSSVEAWRTFASAIGHQVPANATRAEVIAMVEEGLSVEEGWHPLARDWYRSLGESGQSQFYEPSDWQTARVLAEMLSRALSANKVTAALIERWQIGATELLTTEGARRRVRMELERPKEGDGEEVADVSELDEYRRRLREGGSG